VLVVHHLNNSRSQRILWLLEELELPYDLVLHRRDPVTHRSPPSLFKVHPLGKGPTIEHGNTVLIESGAIIDYITRKLAGGRLAVAEASPQFADYLFWMHYAEGSVMPAVVFDFLDRMTGSACGAALRGFYDAEIKLHLGYIDAVLETRAFLVGDAFTAADIQVAWVLELGALGGQLQQYPRLAAYLERMHARPAYQRADARGGHEDLAAFTRAGSPVGASGAA
jgi:glutathione S-transferase